MSTISKLNILFFLAFAFWCIAGCSAQVNLGSRNLSRQFDLAEKARPVKIRVQYQTDSLVYIHYSINRHQIFNAIPGASEPISMKISMKMYLGYDVATASDSISDSLLIYNSGKEFLTGHLQYYVRRDRIMVSEATFRASGGVTFVEYFNIEKPGNKGRQNYLVFDSTGNEILFRNYILRNETVKMKRRENPEKLYLKYYKTEFPIALPPFSYTQPEPFNLKPDSTGVLQEQDNLFALKPESYGLFHFQADTFSKDGLTLSYFGDDFPEVSTLNGMIDPLRYITSKQEFESLKNAINKKNEIDQFWLEAGGNPSRAKELIKLYYSRVEIANRLFSSYLEGWKTDRGMVFLIFGKPDIVTRSAYYESWTYGEGNNLASLVFNFSRLSNPFTDNDFELNRTPNYKNMWFEAVSQWRKGRPFNFDEN